MKQPQQRQQQQLLLAAATAALCALSLAAGAASGAGCGGAGFAPLPGAALNASFAADGFRVVREAAFGGARGALAASSNATTLSTGAPKLALYVEGTGYQMGRLTAALQGAEADRMCRQYVDRFVPSLLAPKLARRYGNTTLFRALQAVVADFLVTQSTAAFEAMVNQTGVFPAPLVAEMRGLADGLQLRNASAPAGFYWQRVVTLNFGMDWLSAHAFAGRLHLTRALLAAARRVGAPPEVRELLLRPPEGGVVRVPLHCDAFGRANPAGGGVLMGRAFQLPTCDVFQEVALTVVAVPSERGRLPTASLTAPGLVGAITSMGLGGTAMGVDTLRSAYSNLDRVGLNAVLLVRHVAGTAGAGLESALDEIGAAQRGCPWLYPLCSTDGCAVVEAGAYDETPPSRLDSVGRFVASKALRARLPTSAWLQQNSGSAAVWRNGTFARTFGYQYPAAVQQYNSGLFGLARQPYNASAFGPAGTKLFPTWQGDRAATRSLLNDYFVPPRTAPGDDFCVVSNVAVVPEMRVSQMAPASDLLALTQESAQWRYDSLAAEMDARRGQAMDAMDAREAITFLSPDRTPGYWNDTLRPGEPMTAQIEGAISVADLRDCSALALHSKTGYWTDAWVRVTLSRYVA